jgi:hypothetical protein
MLTSSISERPSAPTADLSSEAQVAQIEAVTVSRPVNRALLKAVKNGVPDKLIRLG